MKNLLTRTFYGLIFGIIMLGSIIYSVELLSLVMLIVVLIGSSEIIRLHKRIKIKKTKRFYHSIPSLLVYIVAAGVAVQWLEFKALSWILVLLIFPMIIALFSRRYQFDTIVSLHWLTMLFVAIPSALMLFYYRADVVGPMAGPILLLIVIGFIWINDIFAYLVGVSIGKHRLFERVSPKKSWEGSIGGLLATLLAAYLVASLSPWIEMKDAIYIALIVVIMGTLGDLTESKLKREAGVKDSGTLIPGHGGVLDRFDATFFVIPSVFIYLVLNNL